MRWLVALVAAVAALAPSPTAAATVPVVRCPTLNVTGSTPSPPAAVRVLGSPASTAGLSAYSNGEQLIVGPAGMSCHGQLAQDGGAELLVWPKRKRRPGRHAHTAGLSLFADPACIGCQADDACPFFAAFARKLGFPCSTGVPVGETVDRRGSHLVLFEDPAGIAGDGWPSGGPDPANGLVAIHGGLGVEAPARTVYRATCTLPQRAHATCRTSLDDLIARYL